MMVISVVMVLYFLIEPLKLEHWRLKQHSNQYVHHSKMASLMYITALISLTLMNMTLHIGLK